MSLEISSQKKRASGQRGTATADFRTYVMTSQQNLANAFESLLETCLAPHLCSSCSMPTGLFGKTEKDSESVMHVTEAATRGWTEQRSRTAA